MKQDATQSAEDVSTESAVPAKGGDLNPVPDLLPDGWWYVTSPTHALYTIYVVDGLIVTSVMGIQCGTSFRMWHDIWTKWGWQIAPRKDHAGAPVLVVSDDMALNELLLGFEAAEVFPDRGDSGVPRVFIVKLQPRRTQGP